MKNITYKPRPVQEDQWTIPSVRDLLEPLKAQQRKLYETLMKEVEQLGTVEQRVAWFGESWAWTIECVLLDDETGEQLDVLFYLVPRDETSVLSVPLTDHVIEKLPMRRLNRTIREGIRSAKCAVQLHWATWNPTAQTEINHLVDLMKRKIKLTHEAAEA